MSLLIALKALHLVCVVVFAAGLLLLALLLRLQQALPGPGWPQERRLLRSALAWDRRVTGPALLLLWALGLTLALRQGLFGATWLSAKLVLVVALSAAHGMLGGRLRRLAEGQSTAAASPVWQHGFKATALALALVVALAVGKPG